MFGDSKIKGRPAGGARRRRRRMHAKNNPARGPGHRRQPPRVVVVVLFIKWSPPRLTSSGRPRGGRPAGRAASRPAPSSSPAGRLTLAKLGCYARRAWELSLLLSIEIVGCPGGAGRRRATGQGRAGQAGSRSPFRLRPPPAGHLWMTFSDWSGGHMMQRPRPKVSSKEGAMT